MPEPAAFGQSSCTVWPWSLRAPSQLLGREWGLVILLSVQGNSLLVWKGGKGQALMSLLPSIPVEQQDQLPIPILTPASASGEEEVISPGKLQVRLELLLGEAEPRRAVSAQGSKVRAAGTGSLPWVRNSWIQIQLVLQLGCHTQWLQGKMLKPHGKIRIA